MIETIRFTKTVLAILTMLQAHTVDESKALLALQHVAAKYERRQFQQTAN